MLVLIDTIADGIADLPAIAVRHGWPHRSCAAADVVATGDDILLHAADGVNASDTARLLLASAAPTIALASADWIATTDWSAHGYVAAVDRNRLAADLPGNVTDWSHAARLATIDRLAGTFGKAPVARLLDGLRGALEQMLDAPHDMRLTAAAHRIAGLAGTLGFAALGRHWLRVAEYGHAPDAATRRATAHALLTLDRAENV
ncbi:MAG: hypothetical protein PGN16_01590 [Sphingomonas phyllosphaerae]